MAKVRIRWDDGEEITGYTFREIINKLLRSNPVNPIDEPTEEDRKQWIRDAAERANILWGIDLNPEASPTEFFHELHKRGIAAIDIYG